MKDIFWTLVFCVVFPVAIIVFGSLYLIASILAYLLVWLIDKKRPASFFNP